MSMMQRLTTLLRTITGRPKVEVVLEDVDQEPVFTLDDMIGIRTELDTQCQRCRDLEARLQAQQDELDHLRNIALAAAHIWSGRAARDRLASLVRRWQESWGK